ncbi:acetoacetate-CoA ligase [Lactarius sanguifluus]|nr:acetoacetate-CoA ligase [Lactarius sanguifluus]
MSQDLFAGSRLLSKPVTPEDTNVEVLRRFVNRKHGLNLKDYSELHEYSVTDYTFWLDLWQFLGIISSVPPAKVLGEGYIKEVPRWFPGARLNYAENMLWRTDDGIAITETNETGHVASYSYRELRELVRKFATALRLHGLQPGDRVAAVYLIGLKGVLDRYRQVLPKFIFSETESIYAGKTFNLIPKVSEVVQDLSSKGLGHAILLPGIKSGQEVSQEVVNSIPLSKTLSAFLASDDGRPLTFEQLPFDHPLYILYSSGTTGPPKCIIHSGGVRRRKLIAHLDVGIHDTYFQFTTTAWMMWPYMLAGLACGARMIVYEGSPFYPDVKTYLKFIDEQNVSVFGTSPRFISEVQGRGVHPRRDIGNFEALRRITTTGAVLSIPQYGWMKTAFNDRAVICAGSGGTGHLWCIAVVSSVPALPVYAGEMQGKTLGVAGELVCTRPHPSVPIRFWGDDARGTKFLNAYYDTYPGIWRHGDFMAMNPRTKGYMILGRSDGVLNPSGVRFGSGEIYSVLERPVFSARIDDTICDKDERVLLFVKMRAGHKLDPAFEQSIRAAIRSALSTRHVPAYIFEVEELPYTVNGKKIEIAVKKIVSGMRVVASATVANPESLESYYKYQDIEKFAQAAKKGNDRDAKL